MISSKLILICSYSIVLAVIIGIFRFRKINRAYQPFIYITALTLISELAGALLIRYYRSNAISMNIVNVVSYVLWMWQFKRWGAFRNAPKGEYNVLLATVILIWMIENIILQRITIFSSLFSTVSSFVIVFLAINQVNGLIVQARNNMLRNSMFLICSALLFFHTYKIMIESFYVMRVDESTEFLSNIFIILVFVNLFVNLLYALATIWIPTRQRFSMQF